MKKNILLFAFCSIFALVSCSSDDSSISTEVTPIPSTVEWIPGQISLMSGSTVLFTESYPHANGCDKDYIRLVGNTSATLFEHEPGTCAITETTQSWNRNGNQISLVIFDTPVTGTIISETATQLTIESDVSQYSAMISLLYPEIVDYLNLIQGAKVRLVLDKK